MVFITFGLIPETEGLVEVEDVLIRQDTLCHRRFRDLVSVLDVLLRPGPGPRTPAVAQTSAAAGYSTGSSSLGTAHSVPECGFEGLKTYQAPAST